MSNTTQVERGDQDMILVTDYDYELKAKAQTECTLQRFKELCNWWAETASKLNC